jgi:hypothetical protein
MMNKVEAHGFIYQKEDQKKIVRTCDVDNMQPTPQTVLYGSSFVWQICSSVMDRGVTTA